ncbi:hypothetical protein BKA69DRAFT_696191 [Paraphysoderma sedebokerense]|nr:hypothetical protein BKA69DRAFT_696191 [Paraphysoderma sedebokerense]
MSKTVKTLLKSARDKINQKDYPEALEYANQVVDLDPDNYNARIFLGVCYTKLNQFGKAEKEYEEAVKRDKENLMGWQGLAQLYEISKDIDKLMITYHKLMEMYLESQEAAKFWEVTQKLMSLYEEKSMKKKHIAFLQLLTPPNPYHQFLAQSSDLSPPVPSPLELYQKMIALQESYEHEYTKSEINARRYRLGSGGLVKVTADVEREVAMESEVSFCVFGLQYSRSVTPFLLAGLLLLCAM